jgi:hypothetical protein
MRRAVGIVAATALVVGPPSLAAMQTGVMAGEDRVGFPAHPGRDRAPGLCPLTRPLPSVPDASSGYRRLKLFGQTTITSR